MSRGLAHALVDHRLLGFPQLQAEGHVVEDGHVRIERVVLEHHRDVAILGRHVVDLASADRDRAAGDLLQPRDHAQQGRLAAARRADQDDEFAVLDIDIDAVDNLYAAERLFDVPHDDVAICFPTYFISIKPPARERTGGLRPI